MNAKQAVALSVAVAAVVVVFAMAILGGEEAEDDGRLRVVATFYPLSYLAGEIGGDAVTVTTLIPPNQEVHAFHPTTQDRLATARAEVILWNGAGLDVWFEEDILPDLDTRGKVVVETTKGLDLLGPDHGEGDDGKGHDHDDVDPHTWTSPHMVLQQAMRIHEALVEADPGNATLYDANWEVLRGRLGSLDAGYASRLANATSDKIIVTHEAYGYLAHRYGFEQHGVIGVSADEQPSAATIADLVDLMADEGIYVVYVDPVYSEDYAMTLRRELEDRTGETVKVLKLYFMLGVVDGKDMIGQMEANLESLAEGLGAG